SDPWAGLRVPTYAKGTNFHPGGMAIVGEKGPELLNMPRGSQVIPNNVLSSMPRIAAPSGGGSQPVNINVNVEGANGDAHVVALVHEGVSRGLKEFPRTGAFKAGVQSSVTRLGKERKI